MTWPFTDIAAAIVGAPLLVIGQESGAFGTSGDQTACLTQANVDTSSLDAKIAAIATWNPTGYFSSSQVYQIVNQTTSLIGTALSQVGSAPQSTGDAADTINGDIIKLNDQAAQAQTFLGAAAANTNATLYSPGLKAWVVNSMNAASNSIVDAYTFQCAQGPVQAALAALGTALDSLWGVLQTIAGFAEAEVKAAIAAGQVIVNIPDKVAQYATYLEWGAGLGGLLLLAAGAFYVYRVYGGVGSLVSHHANKALAPVHEALRPIEGLRQRRRR